MFKPKWVVVDKDFLQADQDGLNKVICHGHRLLLTARTGYEIHTTNKQGVRQKCLQTLLNARDNVDVIDEDGSSGLLNYEIKEKKPSSAVLQEYVKPLPYDVDQFLKNIDVLRWNEDFEKGPAKDFSDIAFEMRNKISWLVKDDLKVTEKIKKAYSALTKKCLDLPAAENIDENWIIFRRLQVERWMVLDRECVSAKNMLHDRIDSRIAEVALLTRGLASNETLMKNIFNFLCPEGELFSTYKNDGSI
jgi:hypothetical protein